MPEFLSHPAFLPALLGFLGGLFLTFAYFSQRLAAMGAAAIQQEKAAAGTIAELKVQAAAMQEDITQLRSSEARLIKRQGQLEAISGSVQEQQEAMSEHLLQNEATLRDGLIRLENTMLNVIRKSPQRPEIQEFVPQVPSAQTGEPENLENQKSQPSKKAESAANVLRAALNDPKS